MHVYMFRVMPLLLPLHMWHCHVFQVITLSAPCTTVMCDTCTADPLTGHACCHTNHTTINHTTPPWLVVPVIRSCQSPIWIWLVNYLHLHLHLQALGCTCGHLDHSFFCDSNQASRSAASFHGAIYERVILPVVLLAVDQHGVRALRCQLGNESVHVHVNVNNVDTIVLAGHPISTSPSVNDNTQPSPPPHP